MSKRLAALESRLGELRQRLASVRSDLSRQREPLSADFADQATQRENDEVLEQIGRSTEQELAQLDNALRRVQDGKDGICAVCGSAIAAARLEAVPYTDRCSACAA
jgi:DnaK suppressor protein